MGTVIILVVLEPQASGSWHLHGLIKKQEGKLPFIDNNEVLEPMSVMTAASCWSRVK